MLTLILHQTILKMIQVIHRALDIMENVAKGPVGPKLLSHIANDLELNQATCANIVKTLLNRNYLKRADGEKGYLLGDKLNEIINQPYIYKDLIEIADVEMDEISKQMNEDSLLVVLNGEHRKIIYNKTCDLRVKVTPPEIKKAYDSSSGRMLLSLLSENELLKFIELYGLPPTSIWKGANTYKTLLKQLEIIRNTGYIIIEDSAQVVGISAPIYYKKKVVASLSIYLPAFRFSEALRKKMINLATQVTNKISTRMEKSDFQIPYKSSLKSLYQKA